MNQVILGYSGRKQSGKNTSYNCMRLWRPEAQEFSFAWNLKRVCVDVLGLEEWQAFGTDEQKNTLVPHLLWENFPLPCYVREDGTVFVGYPNGLMFPLQEYYPVARIAHDIGCGPFSDIAAINPAVTVCPIEVKIEQGVTWHSGTRLTQKKGPMSAREVLQYYGTEIFRKHYPQVWADACIRQIRKSGCELAVITDVRFPNEIETIQQAGGKVIRLTRIVYKDDHHPSETALDADKFDWNRFDAVLDNADMDIAQQSEALYAIMRRWSVVNTKNVNRIHF